MSYRVLSLDIAASVTGWAFISSATKKVGRFQYGLIKTSPKFSRAVRLVFFRNEMKKLLLESKPTHIVIEDVFSGLNVKTFKLLSKFAGVAEECCMSTLKVEPYIISTNTVKAYFKVKKKKDIFETIVDILDWDCDTISFKKHNDITDAIAQLLCYCDKILEYRKFRLEKEYGYLYDVSTGVYKFN